MLRTSKFFLCFNTWNNVNIHLGKLPCLASKSAAIGATHNAQMNFIRFNVNGQGDNTSNTQYKHRFSLERILHNLDFQIQQKGRISAKEIKDALYAIKYKGELFSNQALLLIRCCGNLFVEETPQKRAELIEEVLATIKELEVNLDISHYNAILKVYMDNGTEFSPFKFLENLKKNGIEPNRFTFSSLVGYFCVRGDIPGATKMLEVMKSTDIPIDVYILNYLIIGQVEANDMKTAANIVFLMKEKNLEPDADTYAALLYGYAKFGDIKKIRGLLHFCEENKIFLAAKDYMNIIFSLTSNGHSQYVDEILDEVEKTAKYNEEIINLSFRLINEGYDEMAMKVIKSTKPTEHHSPDRSGAVLINYLLGQNQPICKVAKIAKMLKEEGINESGLLIALREVLRQERKDDAIFLLKELKDNRMEVRPHYFYPLFCLAGKNKDNEMLINCVKLMRSLNVYRNFLTVRFFITPNYQISNVKDDFVLLSSTGLRSTLVAEGLFAEYAKIGDLKSCEVLVTNFYVAIFDERLFDGLIEGLVKSGDVKTFVNINAHLFDQKVVNDKESTAVDNESSNELELKKASRENNREEREFRYKKLREVLLRKLALHPEATQYLKPVVEGLLENGIGIRQSKVEQLSGILGNTVPLELLQKLASPDLKQKPVVKCINIEEDVLFFRKRNRNDTYIFSERDRDLIQLIKTNNLKPAVELFENFKAENVLNVFRYGNIIKLYCENGNYEKAVQIGDEMKANVPDEMPTDYLTLYYAEALMNVKRIEEAFSIFNSFPDDIYLPENIFIDIFERYIANTGDIENVRKLFELGNKKKIFHPRYFNAIVHEYLRRKDYGALLDLCSESKERFNFLPNKYYVFKEVILSGNSELIERLTKIAEKYNVRVDLIISFAELNQEKQARKYLESSGLFLKDETTKITCDYLLDRGFYSAIECLLKATKGLLNMNRSILYDYYLTCLQIDDDPEKALNIWTQMQEEDVIPSEEFLIRLSNYLKQNNLEVPFAVRNEGNIDLQEHSYSQKSIPSEIFEAVEENNFDKFCEILDFIVRSEERIPFATINTYVRNEIVFKGEVEKLKKIKQIHPMMKKYVTWQAMFLLAHSVRGTRKEYLLQLFEEVKTKTHIDAFEQVPSTTLFNMALEDPSLVKELEEIEDQAKEENMEVFTTVLWAYHILSKNLIGIKKYRPLNVLQSLELFKFFWIHDKKPDFYDKLLDLKDEIQLTNEHLTLIYNDYFHFLRSLDDLERLQKVYDRAVLDKMDHLISKELLTYVKLRTKPSPTEFQAGRITR